MSGKTSFDGFTPSRRTRPIGRRVVVVVFDGVVLGDLAIPCEVFGRARDRSGTPAYDVRVCAETRRVHAEHLTLEVPHRLTALRRADVVVVPGLDRLERRVPDATLRAIGAAAKRGVRVASICTGAFVLAATGALDGRAATTHWLAADELARRHPSVRVDPRVLYVDVGTVLTSAGAAAAFDLCLHLVRRDLGAEAAAETARACVMPLERAGGQAQFIAHPPAPREWPFAALLAWVEQHLTRDLSVCVLARRAAMSERNFSRRFRKELGTTPATWVARARVRRAQRLLETTDWSIDRVAAEAGFGSATVLRETFARLVGTSPRAHRRSFGAPA
ncbi:GlxA family transcriptional regulator [Sandaracinus amylolyticus]|uniref:Transcriptional regulator n=1 Tax=Sandaracinus amylolyticus TaxID=927083 RepID=A0A0F6W0Q1_9BACT|nr:helix-turn-helix domain-containing protein [Sandaracinus amylolyticus]AKF04467.1 Transcriptional regulator [Sandaracinus amylolyticus]